MQEPLKPTKLGLRPEGEATAFLRYLCDAGYKPRWTYGDGRLIAFGDQPDGVCVLLDFRLLPDTSPPSAQVWANADAWAAFQDSDYAGDFQ